GCDSVITTQLTVNPLPIALASSNSPVCVGDSLNLTAQTVVGGNYQWTGPNSYTSTVQNPSIASSTIASAGNYTLIVELNGCISLPSEISVDIDSCGADLKIVKTTNNLHPYIGETVVFTVEVTNNGPANATGVIVSELIQSGFSYESSTVTNGTYNNSTGDWLIGNVPSSATEVLTITATVLSSGSYINNVDVSANESDPNMGNNHYLIELFPVYFFIPEGFSPNGDRINDLFVITGIEFYPENSIVIFNRWGDKVFKASPYRNTWDGTSTLGISNSDKLPVGTYFYLLDLGGDNVIKGTIYLNR
ncbi:MAG: gliding motility-associated C-terminal domain-containing protein, partial [Bacteroidota bacterium]